MAPDSTDSFSLESYHSTQTSSSVPREQPQEQQLQPQQQRQPPEARPGNPDEIWILRQGKRSAHMILVSDLVEKRYTNVSGLREFLVSKFPDWEEIPPDDIFIKKHGGDDWLAEDTPISELAGNTRLTPHLVETTATTNLPAPQVTVNLLEYLSIIPPTPSYGNLPGPSTTAVADQRRPSLLPWDNYQAEVRNWVVTVASESVERLSPPTWMPRASISNEVSELQPFIRHNVLNPVVYPFNGYHFTNHRDCLATVKAEPDFVLWRGDDGQSSVEVIGFVEVKGKWSVPSETNIREQYESNRYVAGAVNQLFSYLVLNHRKAGILTTYDMTWFFERREENGEEHLYVSDGIPFDSQSPSLFQCIAYFIGNVASSADFKSPPSSRTTSPRLLRKYSKVQEMQRSPLSQSFSADDLNTGPKIGEGRTGNVFLADSDLTALKTLDISKRPHLVSEILNEIAIYAKLEQLQGRIIPTFRYCGLVEDVLFVLGVDYAGKVPSRLNQNQKEALVQGLSEIHSYGILHGDIRLENIVVDSEGNPFIIDFALSTYESDPEKLSEELDSLRTLVSSL